MGGVGSFKNLKNLFVRNHWANFNQTWQKLSLGEGSSFFLKKEIAFFQGDIRAKE
jgi:hypothetical protein